jgi:hypothetical protein
LHRTRIQLPESVPWSNIFRRWALRPVIQQSRKLQRILNDNSGLYTRAGNGTLFLGAFLLVGARTRYNGEQRSTWETLDDAKRPSGGH